MGCRRRVTAPGESAMSLLDTRQRARRRRFEGAFVLGAALALTTVVSVICVGKVAMAMTHAGALLAANG
jgi:hypothetical protein